MSILRYIKYNSRRRMNMYFKLPALPFELDQVSELLSKETIDYHYSRHHGGYIEKLNQLLKGSKYEKSSLEEIITQAEGSLFNNASQAWNHTFYWYSIGSQYKKDSLADYPELKNAISRSFGSFDQFQAKYSEAALNLFGSGWVWLVLNVSTKNIEIIKTSNADNPIRQKHIPLLVCDMWEHAYYIDFRNSRAKYVAAFLKSINWKFVAANYKKKDIYNFTNIMRANISNQNEIVSRNVDELSYRLVGIGEQIAKGGDNELF